MRLKLFSSTLLFVLTTSSFAAYTPTETTTASNPGKFYIGVFGGGGSSNKFNASQFGTAFYTEATGGPLAVNAFGPLNSQSSSFYGAQIGYQAQEIALNQRSQWTLKPAAELEGYSMNNSSFHGDLINNTTRLPEHDFNVTYPMSRTVFLANAVVSFNRSDLSIHPYIGLGIGDAIIRITGANATQISPAEIGINHYNTSTNDSNSTFAGQIKLGLNYDINKYVSLFADYRWLYLASTHFAFGSTVATGHVATSSWQVQLDAQKYNLANVGVRINL